jgi:NAD(P)-dependent dehydrogenase (short-subunit alcohol dehydrogenase family)
LADEIKSAGGWAEAARVDAMNEGEIDEYLSKIAAETGKLDAVFNGIGIRVGEGGYGVPTTHLSFEQFLEPLRVHVGSQFLTARSAARLMIETKSAGTILTLTASLSRLKMPFMAGITAACAAIEGLTRTMAAEFGNFGIKVICLNPTGLSETRTIRETNAANAKTIGIPPEALDKPFRSNGFWAKRRRFRMSTDGGVSRLRCGRDSQQPRR